MLTAFFKFNLKFTIMLSKNYSNTMHTVHIVQCSTYRPSLGGCVCLYQLLHFWDKIYVVFGLVMLSNHNTGIRWFPRMQGGPWSVKASQRLSIYSESHFLWKWTSQSPDPSMPSLSFHRLGSRLYTLLVTITAMSSTECACSSLYSQLHVLLYIPIYF